MIFAMESGNYSTVAAKHVNWMAVLWRVLLLKSYRIPTVYYLKNILIDFQGLPLATRSFIIYNMDLINFIDCFTWRLSTGGIKQMPFKLVYEKTFNYYWLYVHFDLKKERFMLESDRFWRINYFAKHNIWKPRRGRL